MKILNSIYCNRMISILNMKKFRYEEIFFLNKGLLEVKLGKGWCILIVFISIFVMFVIVGF